MDNKTFAYIAGYTDGDGCFNLRKVKVKDTNRVKYLATFIISSTDEYVIKYFAKTFQGSYRLCSDKLKHIGHKPQYHFIIRGRKSLRFIQNILPFLVEKQEEARIYCQFIKSFSKDEKDLLINKIKDIKQAHNLVTIEHKELLTPLCLSQSTCDDDFAYLAGFIDAECCLSLSRYHGKSSPNWLYKNLLQCNNTKIPTIKWALERFGGQIHFIDRHSKNIKERDQITWRLSSKSLADILPKVLPYLKHKKPVCQELIKFYDTTKNLTMSRNNKLFTEHYRPILEARDKIYHHIQFLNRKGTI